MSQDTQFDSDTLLEREPEKIKPPPLFEVWLLNDDYTPMEFVVAILQLYFAKTRETAAAIMLKVHQEGKGVCGVFTKDVAATKVELVTAHAKEAGHPLQCIMQEQ